MAAWLRGLRASLPATPRALLVISGHWEAPAPTVTAGRTPPLIYDYSGFPPHTYQLRWPAPGSPELAERTRTLIAAAGRRAEADPHRGFDHGVFVPLKVAFPEADVPTVQLSLRAGLDPREHFDIGLALAPLRDEGVLVLGSGMSYHNMRGFHTSEAAAHSARFDAWLGETVTQGAAECQRRLVDWTAAPSARASHPREEHLLPLMVVAGAAGEDRGEVVFRDQVMGAFVSAVRFG
jgi:aromatic ring-opening dioxygenase catalytic subunit (LigB family)